MSPDILMDLLFAGGSGLFFLWQAYEFYRDRQRQKRHEQTMKNVEYGLTDDEKAKDWSIYDR